MTTTKPRTPKPRITKLSAKASEAPILSTEDGQHEDAWYASPPEYPDDGQSDDAIEADDARPEMTDEELLDLSQAQNLTGFLLLHDKKGKAYRIIESHGAKIIANRVCRKLAWDIQEGSWYLWNKNHWSPQITNSRATQILTHEVDIGCGETGYRKHYLDGITSLLCCSDSLPLPPMPQGRMIPFKNGLLDLATKKLRPATPDYAMTWTLPYDYEPAATCPNIREWLLAACDGDQETMLFLINWLAALVFGIELQKFLLLLGPGGTGKGTFQRLAMALVGDDNIAVTNLAKLETGTFEAARLFGKRLAMVNEAGKHGGSLNVLKAVTGGDAIPLEKKNIQGTGSFVFRGLVLMASNDNLGSTDMTSGLERRRITVEFKRRASLEEKIVWDMNGGEEAMLHREIPGLVNWLMEIDPSTIRRTIESPPQRIAASNLLGMSAGNSVADWIMERCCPDRDAFLQVGIKEQTRDEVTKMAVYLHADDRAYPNYLEFCSHSGRSYPVSSRKFTETVVDIGATLGHCFTKGRGKTGAKPYGIYGIRLLAQGEDAYSWIQKHTLPPDSEEF